MGAIRRLALAAQALGQHAAGARTAARAPLRAAEVLAKVQALKISTWSYTFEPSQIVRCGPMAQDFYKLFGFGSTDTRIPVESALGVLLVSVQELTRRLEAAEGQLARADAHAPDALARESAPTAGELTEPTHRNDPRGERPA